MSSTPSKNSNALFQAGLKAEAAHNYIEALYKYTACLELGGDQAAIWLKIGNMFLRLGKYHQAASNLEFALGLEPGNLQAIYGLAIAYFYLGRLEEACDFIDRATQLQPDNSTIALDRAHIRSIKDSDPQNKLALYRDWGQRFADPLAVKNRPFDHDFRPDRKLRIGYVSGDMRDHAVAFFMEPIFANHDPERVEVFVFSTSHEKDATTSRLKKLVANWFDVARMADDALFNLIRKKRIDVLVDLSGHTRGHRLPVFARRAAPVQMTWLGYMGGTLGMQAMDYRLTDFNTDPVGNEQFFVETLFRMRGMACYQPPASAPLEALPPMLNTGRPTLISLNSSRKITDRMLSVWKRILELRTDAQLFIHVQEDSAEDAVATMEPRLVKAGLPLDRIILSPRVSLDEFMNSGCIADVALDTSPVSGGTTTLHTLWMGLPVVTLHGHDAFSSTTAATLKGLGLAQWIADSEDEYVSQVLALLDNPDLLIHHRKNIRSVMQASTLMNYREQCAELEGAYQRMWLNYLLGETRFTRSRTPCEDVIEELLNFNTTPKSRAAI
ncbi:UDP-glucose:protein N-beta-glucosyltransferase [Methylophilaceae bacterium]|nr:UDP-glucose:protein N-beta-glucosyltransferase [Methylophilaceae bacterium]